MTENVRARVSQLAEFFHHHLPLAATTSSTPKVPGSPGELFQYSTLEALLGGVYDGEVTVAELLTHGDFGVGTFNGLDGEMIVLDGICYHLRSDGSAEVASGNEQTPFAAVTYFSPHTTSKLDAPITYQQLDAVVSQSIPSPNLTYAVKITGHFSSVRTRTVARQHKPYPTLTEATAGQSETTFTDIAGTLAGYLSPSYEQGITVAGYHLHFIDDSGSRGGHCLDFALTTGDVAIDTITELHLSLPKSGAFLTTPMPGGAAVDEQVRKAEGGAGR